VGLVEFAIVFPILLMLFVGTLDFGRLVYFQQIVSNISREGGSMASRGATDAQVITAAEASDDPLDLVAAGRTVISTIQRQSAQNATPWVTQQTAHGGLTTFQSHVGTVGGPAVVPGITQMADGVTLYAVEVVHRFRPVMPVGVLGTGLYPDTVYDVSYF
jgi:Flp pilus assembly protein TadG